MLCSLSESSLSVAAIVLRESIKQHYGSSRKSAPRESTQPKKKAHRELVSTISMLFCRREGKKQQAQTLSKPNPSTRTIKF